MNWLNVEIKASCADIDKIEKLLHELQAEYHGEDHQIDTYFNTPNGRLKLREGNIENALIHYSRGNQSEPKVSDVTYCKPKPNSGLKEVLATSLGIKIIVDKKRKIFFIDNIKFHVDRVLGLGTFVEIEAIGKDKTMTEDKLREQCYEYISLLGIKKSDLLASSYSDLLLEQYK
jgi:adenylate cyclase class 2